MKKSQELSRKTWKLIAKNLIVLAVLAVAAFIGVMSWFSDYTEASAGTITAKTEASNSLEYYIVAPSNSSDNTVYENILDKLSGNAEYNEQHKDDSDFVAKNADWHKGAVNIDFDDPEFKFLDNLFLCEVTSDGSTFGIPKLKQNVDVAYVDTSESFEAAVPNENYMSFDIVFRSQSIFDIVMKDQSSIEPVNKNNIAGVHTFDTEDDANEETIKPAAIGAVRLSVLKGNNRELLWIPGPCVWFDGVNKTLYTGLSGDGFSGKGSVYYDETAEEVKTTNEGTNNHAYYDSNRVRRTISSNGTSVIASTDGDYELGSDVTVVTMDNNDSENGFYYGRIRVNLWIEGEDSEARLKFVNGKFNLFLKFDVKEHIS